MGGGMWRQEHARLSGEPDGGEVVGTEGAETGASQMQLSPPPYLAEEPGLYPVPTNPA